MWTDTHCHPQMDERDAEELIERAREQDVDRLVVVGTNLSESQGAIAVAERFGNVWATIGLHPHEATSGLDGLEELIAHPKVVGIGECGLDYFYEHSPRDAQRDVFAQQIRWAHENNKALVIHTRDAWDDTFAVLASESAPERTLFHCFTGGVQEAKRALDIGGYLSFSGIVTFKTAGDIRAAAEFAPIDRIVVETDAPWLTPEPHRGKPNEPALVAVVGEYVARCKNIDPGDFARQSSDNAACVFALP